MNSTEKEVAQDARATMVAQQDLKKHLKGLSKNQLIQTVIELGQACAAQLEINKILNEKFKQYQGAMNEKNNASADAGSKSE